MKNHLLPQWRTSINTHIKLTASHPMCVWPLQSEAGGARSASESSSDGVWKGRMVSYGIDVEVNNSTYRRECLTLFFIHLQILPGVRVIIVNPETRGPLGDSHLGEVRTGCINRSKMMALWPAYHIVSLSSRSGWTALTAPAATTPSMERRVSRPTTSTLSSASGTHRPCGPGQDTWDLWRGQSCWMLVEVNSSWKMDDSRC